MSIAMLTVETLGPTERAVLVLLREVFEVPYGEIAEAVGKSAAAVRQIARRAREARGGPAAAGAGEPVGAAGRGGAVPGRAAHRPVAGTAGRHGTGRGSDRRRRRPCGRRSGSDPRGRAGGEHARRPDRVVSAVWLNGAPAGRMIDGRGGPRGHPRGGGREGDADPRDREPAETDTARSTGRTGGRPPPLPPATCVPDGPDRPEHTRPRSDDVEARGRASEHVRRALSSLGISSV